MKITYLYLEEILENNGIEMPDFLVCNMDSANYKVMRAQLRAKFCYSEKEGPVVVSEDHDEKCEKILKKGKEEHADLLLMPEYCLSYELLAKITGDEELWPEQNQLWCLPCQGIKYKDFFQFIKNLKDMKNGAVVVLEDAIDPRRIAKPNYFINALFYCFTAYTKTGEKKLVLVPQLKTQSMADREYLCEAEGMTLGSAIYVVGCREENRLVTLLCADSLNSEIQWEQMRKEAGGKSLTILHPQLNANPKHGDFSGIRQKIFQYCERAVHITCNWAGGTILERDGAPSIRIGLSWSCVYYKYEDKGAAQEWFKRKDILEKNAEHGLYGAFMRRKLVAVWFADSNEVVQEFRVRKPCSNAYAVTMPKAEVAAVGHYDVHDFSEAEDFCLLRGIPSLSKAYCELVQKYKDVEKYNFPLLHHKKYEVDQFFALASLRRPDSAYEIDEQENLSGWSLLLDEEERCRAQKGLRSWNDLIYQIEQTGFPKHLAEFRDDYKFCWMQEDEKRPCGNVTQEKGNGRLIMGVADDVNQAEWFVKQLCAEMLKDYIGLDSERAAYMVCVYGKDLLSHEYETFPKIDTSISSGEAGKFHGNITNGDD